MAQNTRTDCCIETRSFSHLFRARGNELRPEVQDAQVHQKLRCAPKPKVRVHPDRGSSSAEALRPAPEDWLSKHIGHCTLVLNPLARHAVIHKLCVRRQELAFDITSHHHTMQRQTLPGAARSSGFRLNYRICHPLHQMHQRRNDLHEANLKPVK